MATITISNNDVTLKNSTYNSVNGRYVLGGQTEVSSFALEWWNKATITLDPTDILYAVEQQYVGKPHMLGYVFYGDQGLWWIICQYNGVIDPNEELIVGKVLRIPLKLRIMAELNKQKIVGGIPSTRGV